MKKGFTLIELLAVILILGIIALIAIPAVSNVIEDAKKGSAEVTGENYIKAVQNKLSLAQLQGGTVLTGTQSVSTIDSIYENIISGEGPTTGTMTIENGKVVSAELEVKGYTLTCTNGKCTAAKGNKVYKYFSVKGNAPTTLSNSNLTDTPTKNAYLKYDVTDGILKTPQACMTNNGKELCIDSSSNGENYLANKSSILNYFGYDESQGANPNDNTVSCNISDSITECIDSFVRAGANNSGIVETSEYSVGSGCYVFSNGRAGCR